MILVSACLAGESVRYNATDALNKTVKRLVAEKKAIMICPELLAGFSTPRPPAEIKGGDGHDVLKGFAKVIEKTGKDVTQQYIDGARKALEFAKKHHVTHVVLKEGSPSCGSDYIYNGEFNGQTNVGVGVTTALFRQHHIQVVSEHYLSVDGL
ncbi:2-thiouracil desulfurase family protein [Acinetobacter pollinis]|uniref:DUF523 domain-containing protein n=1 Tax=Acinetobacter pollinis TaxID=2605270 RepID=A0ABU6DT08_9GAMM|nr:DUF523 domain-containing protein [Acinetobacter pollinis]MEB5476830.1 DUF523 domain-containing protein [Acinetobacter pollinis]